MNYKSMTMGMLTDALREARLTVIEVEAEINDRKEAARDWRQDALRGDKVGAIKKYRTLTGFGLYESKVAVEEFLSFHASTLSNPWATPDRGPTTLGDVLRESGHI